MVRLDPLPSDQGSCKCHATSVVLLFFFSSLSICLVVLNVTFWKHYLWGEGGRVTFLNVLLIRRVVQHNGWGVVLLIYNIWLLLFQDSLLRG